MNFTNRDSRTELIPSWNRIKDLIRMEHTGSMENFKRTPRKLDKVDQASNFILDNELCNSFVRPIRS